MARHTGNTAADPILGADLLSIAIGQRCTWKDEDGNLQHCTVDEVRDDEVRVRFGRGEGRWVPAADIGPARRRLVFQAPGEAPVKLEPSEDDLCYHVSKWPRMLWNEYRDGHPLKVEEVTKRGLERAPRFPEFMRELFARLLNPHTPKLDPAAEGAQWAEQAHGQATDLPAWQQLVATVDGDEMNAGLGAVAVAETLAAEMRPRESKADLEEIRQRLESLASMEEAGVDVGNRIEHAQRELQAAQEEAEQLASGMDPTVIRTALRKACEAAQEEIEEANRTLRAFTYGSQAGVPVRMPLEQRRKFAELLKANPKLKDIAKRLGRLRRIADARQHTKTDRAREEVHDVEQGADLDRLLPSEAVALAAEDEVLAVYAFGKYTERRLLQYKLRGREKQGRGPIVVCFDESGSMQGDPEFWQKAVGLALLDVALRQKRSWAAVHFDEEVHRIDLWENKQASIMHYQGGRGAPRIEHKASAAELVIDTCTHFTGGGTNFEKPLRTAAQVIEHSDYQRADVLMITDGNAPLSPDFVKEFLAVKARKQFRLYVVTVGSVGNLDHVRAIADQVWTYREVMEDDGNFNDTAFGM